MLYLLTYRGILVITNIILFIYLPDNLVATAARYGRTALQYATSGSHMETAKVLQNAIRSKL